MYIPKIYINYFLYIVHKDYDNLDRTCEKKHEGPSGFTVKKSAEKGKPIMEKNEEVKEARQTVQTVHPSS